MGNNKNENKKFDSYKNYITQLENEYKTTFEKIEIYINGSSKLNSLEKNDCLLEILDNFLSAQAEGMSINHITGIDLKKYCDSMIYGEAIHIYKASRFCFILLGAFFYISYMHFFIDFFKAIINKDSNLFFRPMPFGIGEIVLAIGYMFIPKLISLITRNYFENPVRCKKVKKYTYNIVWLITIMLYTFAKDLFQKYVIVISFSNVILILIYLTIISVIVWLLIKTFQDEKTKVKKDKYLELLNKEYEKHLSKCEKRNKKPLDWKAFLKKKTKETSIFTMIFFVYGIIFLIFAVLIGRGMLVKGKLDAVGIIMLLLVSFLATVLVGVVKEGFNRNKHLTEIKS
jgi:DNA-binding ferritin-like protein (Dps family)